MPSDPGGGAGAVSDQWPCLAVPVLACQFICLALVEEGEGSRGHNKMCSEENIELTDWARDLGRFDKV